MLESWSSIKKPGSCRVFSFLQLVLESAHTATVRNRGVLLLFSNVDN
jgi:hypothetical protein